MGSDSSNACPQENKLEVTRKEYVSFKLNKVFSVYIFETQKHEPWEIFCTIKIGELEQRTTSKIESLTVIPNWDSEIKTFKVPDGVDTGIIEVYQIHRNITTKLGFIEFDIDTISEGDEIHQYNEKIISSLAKKTVGTINFQTQGSQSDNAQFSDPYSTIHPRKNLPKNESVIRQFWDARHGDGISLHKKKSNHKIQNNVENQQCNEQERTRQHQKIKRRLLQPLPVLGMMKKLSKYHTTFEKPQPIDYFPQIESKALTNLSTPNERQR